MPAFNLDAWVARSGALDLSAVAWEDAPRYPAYPETIPMGSGVQLPVERNFLARSLFAGEERRVAIRRQDPTLRQLPGVDSAPRLEAGMDRNIGRSSSVSGGHNGHGHH
jgi:hypothetical protein